MPKFLLITLLCTALGLWCQAQTLQVRDKATLAPLPFASLYSQRPAHSATTDAAGQVDVAAFALADSILISYIGYAPVWRSYEALRAQQFQLFLEASSLSVHEVVVSASRWAQPQQDVPRQIKVIRPNDMALQNPQTVADLMGLGGGAYVQKSQLGGGSPMIRGFAANRVLIAVDGVRMNSGIFRSGNLQNIIALDPLMADKAELLFGPGSVQYGSDALGGVMNLSTSSPMPGAGDKAAVSARAALRYASASHERTAHLQLSLARKRWALLSSATHTDFGDLQMGAHGPAAYLRPTYVQQVNGRDTMLHNPRPRQQTPTGYKQWNNLQKIVFQPNAHWHLQYAWHWSRSSDVPRYDRLIEYRSNGLPRDAQWYYGPQAWQMHHLSAEHRREHKLYSTARLSLARQGHQESRHTRSWGSRRLAHRTEQVAAWSANLDLEKKLPRQQTLRYGAEAIHNTVRSTAFSEQLDDGSTRPESTRYPDGARWQSYAAYLGHDWRISPAVGLQSGLRYSHILVDAAFDSAFFDFPFTQARLSTGALTGSVGATLRLSPRWLLRANLSSGFRAPNVDDVAKVFDSQPGFVVVPNPQLRPEYAYNAEAGLQYSVGERLELGTTLFYTRLQQALVRRDAQFAGQDSLLYDGVLSRVQAIQNAARATVMGIDGQAQWKLSAHWSLLGHLTYQYGREELDNGETAPLRHAAPLFGGLHLRYGRQRLSADAYVDFNGAVPFSALPPSERQSAHLYAPDADGQPHAPAWHTLNLKALYQLLPALQVTAGVENITNRRYRPFASGIAAPGRNWIVALRGRF